MVRPGYESGGFWDWGPAKEAGFSLPGGDQPLPLPGEAAHPSPFDRSSFMFPEALGVPSGNWRQKKCVSEKSDSLKPSLVKAFGRDKLIQEDRRTFTEGWGNQTRTHAGQFVES